MGKSWDGTRSKLTPPFVKTTYRAIVWCHGSGDSGSCISLPGRAGQPLQAARLAKAGYKVVAGPMVSTTNWGNPAAQAEIPVDKATLSSVTTKYVALGLSMGFLAALNRARSDANCIGVIGFIGVLDLGYVRDNNVGGAKAAIDTAWGLGGADPLPVGANPYTTAGLTVPVAHWLSNDDVFTPIQRCRDWLYAPPRYELHDLGALAHTEATIAAIPTGEVFTFLNSLPW